MSDYELRPELLALQNLNPFVAYNSASRQNMFASHVGQMLVLKEPSIKRLLSGVEREYGKYTHKIIIPCDARVIKIINKYNRRLGDSQEMDNPVTTIIFQNLEKDIMTFDYVDIVRNFHVYECFGFDYVLTEEGRYITEGDTIMAGTVLAHSPNIDANGNYRYGVSLNTAFMDIPEVTEDGVVISESAVRKMTTTGYGKRTISFGRESYPLAIYSKENKVGALPSDVMSDKFFEDINKDSYKIFPDIGERIRADGLLFATRKYDDMLAPALMSSQALRHPSEYDDKIHAEANAIVTDIIIHKGGGRKSNLPTGMDTQCMTYHQRTIDYYKAVKAEYDRIIREYGKAVRLSPKFHQLCTRSIGFVEMSTGHKIKPVKKSYRLDEWTVTIKYRYDILPGIRSKCTDSAGGGKK